ncbi:MAG: SprT-like domain-containing protein [Chthoniobacterales bacterium]
MKKQAKRKVAVVSLPVQRQLSLAHEGRFFDLRAIFNRLNGRHFRHRLSGYRIVWGRRRRLRPVSYFVYGTIQEEDRVIRIHPLLDAAFVPEWFLEYVIYHEMLHAVVPDIVYPSGRRKVHTEEFQRKEKKFRHYARAQRWEAQNLARFLR